MRFSIRGGLVAVGACFDLGQDYLISAAGSKVDIWYSSVRFHTLQAINSPLLKLLEGDFRCGRRVV